MRPITINKLSFLLSVGYQRHLLAKVTPEIKLCIKNSAKRYNKKLG